MGILEAFLGAGVAGFGLLLMAVAALAWQRAKDRKMAVLACAFAAQSIGGALLLAAEVLGGGIQAWAPVGFAAATLASLLLLYGALFARRG